MFPYLRTIDEFIRDCETKHNGSEPDGGYYGSCVRNCPDTDASNCKNCQNKTMLVDWLFRYCDKANWGKNINGREIKAWCQSLCVYVHDVFEKVENRNLVIGLECYMDNYSDFKHGVVCDMVIGGYGIGKDNKPEMKLLVVENKQWSNIEVIDEYKWKWSVNEKENKEDNPAVQVSRYKECLVKSIVDEESGECPIHIEDCVFMHNQESSEFKCDENLRDKNGESLSDRIEFQEEDDKEEDDEKWISYNDKSKDINYPIMRYRLNSGEKVKFFLRVGESIESNRNSFASYIDGFFNYKPEKDDSEKDESGVDDAAPDAMDVFRRLKKEYRVWNTQDLAGLLIDDDENDDAYIEGKYIVRLHPDQKNALNKLKDHVDNNINSIDIINGVPGSGKTLVALLLMRHLKKSGKNVVFAVRTNTQKNAYLDECISIIGEKIKEEDADYYSSHYQMVNNAGSLVNQKRKITALVEEYNKEEHKNTKIEKCLEIISDIVNNRFVYWNDLKENGEDENGELQKAYDAIIFDEVQRFNNDSYDVFKEMIEKAEHAILLEDPLQIFDEKEHGSRHVKSLIGDVEEAGSESYIVINEYGEAYSYCMHSLWSQFRCNRDEGYVSWVEQFLDIEGRQLTYRSGTDKPDDDIHLSELDFKPELIDRNKLEAILKGESSSREARENADADNIVILSNNWFEDKASFKEGVGLPELDDDSFELFTGNQGLIVPGQVVTNNKVAGLEYENILVIIGPDLKYEDLESDNLRRENPERENPEDEISDIEYIKYIYRALLTRGLKECYIYICDDELKKRYDAMR